MDDYISREEAKRELLENATIINDRRFMKTCDAMAMLDLAPAADVRPVVRGEWIPYDPIHTDCMCCSECEWIVSPSDSEIFAFCPNCGADMRPQEADEQGSSLRETEG